MLGSNRSLGMMRNMDISALDDTQIYPIRRTHLHLAIVENNQLKFDALLNAPDLKVNVVDEEMRTPLHTAALFGRYDMLCALLARGAASNRRDNKGHTPLHEAVNPIFIELTEQHVQITRILLEKGAKASMQTATGFTPLIWMGKFLVHGHVSALRAGYMFSLAQVLLEFGAKADEFSYENPDLISTSKRGREDEEEDEQIPRCTPLTWAVSLALDDIVRLFESTLRIDPRALEDATSSLLQLSLLTDSKRQRETGRVTPPHAATHEGDDLGKSVYGAGV
jgi:hypothetical protein